MSNLSANKQPQEGRISLQQILIGLAIVVGIALYWLYPMAILYLGIAGAGGLLAWNYAEKKRLFREAQARANSYANICGPVLVASLSPTETVDEVQARAAEFREQLKLSGNPYSTRIPILAYPYQPMLYGPGQLTAAWNIYQRMAAERLHQENLRWAEDCPVEIRGIFLSQVMPQPKEETI